MDGKAPAVYLTHRSLQLLESRCESLSGAINQTVDRYDQILKHIVLPPFTTTEIMMLLSATSGVLYQPAEMISGLWQGIEDGLLDDLASEIGVAEQILVEKLKGLTYPQEVALLEHIEQRRLAPQAPE